MNIREAVKDKKRIVIKIGSSSLMHNETGRLNLGKIEKLVRTIVDIKKWVRKKSKNFFRTK